MFKKTLLSFAAAATFAAGTASAFGPEGHRIVAQIAADHLTPQASAQVQDLLAGEDEPTLPGIANWADETRNGQTAMLHFVNFPRGDCHFTPAICPDGKCAVGGIRRYYAELADKSNPRENRQIALFYVVHFVGDLHQPLHAGWADDKGGNTYQVRFGRKGTNLHHVWDTLLLDSVDRDWQHYAARLSQRGTMPGALAGFNPEAWAEESCRGVNTPGFYPEDRIIDQAYLERWQPAIDDRLTIAGQRLAAVLNSALR